MSPFSSSKKIFVSLVTLAVFVSLLAVGVTLAQRKPLWNDELFTQIESVERFSVAGMLAGKIREGNNAPLFYWGQKMVCAVTGYRFPLEWKGTSYVDEPRGQVVLRLSSIFFTALMVALIFHYFARVYSWGAGLYALAVSLACSMFWAYWAEARPYALWMCLSTIQALLFLGVMREQDTQKFPQPQTRQKFWIQPMAWLVGIHWLLGLTVVFGAAQIAMTVFLLAVFKRPMDKRHLVWLALPILAPVFYYFRRAEFYFWFTSPPLTMIYKNIPREWLGLMLGYVLGVGIFWGLKKAGRARGLTKSARPEERAFFFFALAALAAGLSLLGLFKIIEVTDRGRFDVVARYFAFLAPIGVLAVIFLSVDLMRRVKNYFWLRLNVGILLGGLLLIRLVKTFFDVYTLALYVN